MQSGSACGQQRQPPDPFVSLNFFTPCPQSRRLSHRALLWWITLSSSLSCTSHVLSTPPCQTCPSHRPPLNRVEIRLAWTVNLLSCTFSPNQAVAAHLSPDSLAWSSAVHAITHTPVKSMQEMAHWSPQRAPHNPGAPISTLYPGLRSARQDVFPHSTGLEVQRLDHPAQITRPRFRPRTSRQQGPPERLPFVHPTITVSRRTAPHNPKNSPVQSGSSEASAYLHEGSPASRSRSHLSDLPVSTVPQLQTLAAFLNQSLLRSLCLSLCP